MAVIKSGSSSFKPYARIMSIIGDQLITDKLVALVEIVKNSYDADARNVIVRFGNWVAKPTRTLPLLEPYIEIEDDGNGMDEETLLNVFLNPGTPNKLLQKKENRTTPILHRTMQGEKGIGRFAINKLGNLITIYSKTLTSSEIQLNINFEDYDSDNKNKIEDFRLLSEIENKYVVNEPPIAIHKSKGTIIRIEKLKQSWSNRDFKSLSSSLQRLVAPTDILREEYHPNSYQPIADFAFELRVNDILQSRPDDLWREVLGLAPFKMIGTISNEGILSYKYIVSQPFKERALDNEVNLTDTKHLEFPSPILKRRFGNKQDDFNQSLEELEEQDSENDITDISIKGEEDVKGLRKPQQGLLQFSFYVYDFRLNGNSLLNKTQKEFVESHNVFVFRDNIRVYPFGEKDFDWLELSRSRGEIKTGWFYSTSQLVGFVYITGKDNPKLRDTTSRYGLMDIDGAYDDFQALIAGTLNAMKAQSDIDVHNDDIRKEKNLNISYVKVDKAYKALAKEIGDTGNEKLIESVNEFKQTFETSSTLLKERMESYEDLAGLGLAVEKSSHDAIMVLRKSFGTIEDLKNILKEDNALTQTVNDLIEELRFSIDIVYNELQIIQPLFRISRRTQATVDIRETIEKAIKYFRHELNGLDVQTIYKGSPLEIHATQGLLLQVFINLLDNAIYWLKERGGKKKTIIIEVDGDNRSISVADNGIGIDEELSSVVFESFFSRKESGRGLGLFITRELLARMGATIRLIYSSPKHILPGANFLIKFEEA